MLQNMTGLELEKFMKRNDVSAVDIAAALKMHPNTILKFLKGFPARRSTTAAFERYIASVKKRQSGGLKTAGT